METWDRRARLIAGIADLKEHDALALVQERLALGDDPIAVVADFQEGMRQVGERYENRVYYLSGLIMASEIFREAMKFLQPALEQQFSGSETGAIMIGTVRGDIHDIGKNNLGLFLHCHGFTVHDLGVDVSPGEFLIQATRIGPDIIGLSGLLTGSYEAMRETIQLIRSAADDSLRSVPIIIGGNQLTEQVCRYVGADFWVNDAMNGVRLCQNLLNNGRGPEVQLR